MTIVLTSKLKHDQWETTLTNECQKLKIQWTNFTKNEPCYT